MSIASQLIDLNDIKQDIKSAILSKGQTVADNMTIYASAIANISTGGTYEPDYLRLKSTTGSMSIGLSGNPSHNPNIQYSYDQTNWSVFPKSSSYSVSVNQDQYLYLRGNNLNGWASEGLFTIIDIRSGQCDLLEGDITTLIGYEGPVVLNAGSFKMLFAGSNIIDASGLKLQTENLRSSYYESMFASCTSLTKAPEVVIDSIHSSAFGVCASMFSDCTSLTEATVKINVSGLGSQALCTNMFGGCSSLEDLYLYSTTYNSASLGSIVSSSTGTSLSKIHMYKYDQYHTIDDWDGKYIYFDIEPVSKAVYCDLGDNVTLQSGASEMYSNVDVIVKDYDYLCFENIGDTDATVYLRNYGNNNPDCKYSSDLSVWTTMPTSSGNAVTIPAESRIYLKGNNPNGWSVSDTVYSVFVIDGGNIKLSGNIMTLIDEIGGADVIPSEYCFMRMFINCTSISNASELELPAITLTLHCYHSMFNSCTSLATAPELPAMTLAEYCYYYMFYSCISLTIASELPAMTLARNCYAFMFQNCISLETVPALPATTLATYCYNGMFRDCISLEIVPELPATTLVDGCYAFMFYSCTSLNRVECCATDISASGCLTSWLDNVSSTGTFKQHGSAVFTGIPSSWKRESDILSFRIGNERLAQGSVYLKNENSNNPDCEYSYDLITWASMPTDSSSAVSLDPRLNKIYVRGNNPNGFSDISYGSNKYSHFDIRSRNTSMYAEGNIMSLQDRHGDTLVLPGQHSGGGSQGPFRYLFNNCFALASAPKLPATYLTASCYSHMFDGCVSLRTTPELPADYISLGAYASMFENCTSLINAPELPATEGSTASYYYSMFKNCTSLVNAPVINLGYISSQSAGSMFDGCTSLQYVKCMAKSVTLSPISIRSWLPSDFDGELWLYQSLAGRLPQGPDGIPASAQLRLMDTGVQYCTRAQYDSWEQGGTLDIDTWYIITDKSDGKKGYPMFISHQNGSTIGLASLSSNQIIEYSYNKETWTNMTTSTILTLNDGDRVYMRGMLNGNNTSSDYTQFTMSGSIAGSGNLNFIWNKDNPNAPLKEHCGYSMFRDCASLTTTPELPAMTLAESCYYSMFYNCTSLETAPELPATTLATACYTYMFDGCASLTTAPELPAEALAQYCYYGMFEYCTSLETAPELPATTLTSYCYYSMFYGCTSLETAPELPATTLMPYCYQSMFSGCTHLNGIRCLAISGIGTNNSITNWLYNVSATGDFYKASSAAWPSGVSGIPSGWTVHSI